MGNWQKTKIGKFLFERKGKYKPSDERIAGLKRINKIDFSGNFHIVQKPSKTDMILIKSGDLVISGINVSKGAMGIYNGNEDVVATIHYSSYTFDSEKINVKYFKRFLKSDKFINLLKEQVKGGIKTEIKPKHILPLEIDLPSIDEQENIVSNFQKIENEDEELKQEISNQQSLLKKLRQQILQEAIEGKLTKDWRKNNPNVEPAKELLKRIKAEKEQLIKEKKTKKQKPLPPITEEEKPFKLPENWVWCRLGEIITMIYGNGLTKAQCIEGGSFPVYGSNGIVGYYNSFLTEKRVIIIGRKGSAGALNVCELPSWTTDVAYYVEENNYFNFEFLFHLLQSLGLAKIGKGIKPGVNRNEAYNLIVPLSPLPEQKAIVEKLEKLFAVCDELVREINENKIHSEQLMQAVLREAFSHSDGI